MNKSKKKIIEIARFREFSVTSNMSTKSAKIRKQLYFVQCAWMVYLLTFYPATLVQNLNIIKQN